MEIQSRIIKTIQQVDQKIDLIPISKVNCQQDIEEFEKGVEIMEKRMDEEMRQRDLLLQQEAAFLPPAVEVQEAEEVQELGFARKSREKGLRSVTQ